MMCARSSHSERERIRQVSDAASHLVDLTSVRVDDGDEHQSRAIVHGWLEIRRSASDYELLN